MKQMKFKVTLSTDVVLNVKSATDGNNQTLDFIPGNNFLGIVAGRLYQKVDTQTAWTLFHSGNKLVFSPPLKGVFYGKR